jgi:hypothetical protein
LSLPGGPPAGDTLGEEALGVIPTTDSNLGLKWGGILLLAGLLVVGVEAFFLQQPGYMDACYSFNAGRSLTHGSGLQDPYLWNYLDDPQGIPHLSHTYWMPLPSLLVALGSLVISNGFRGAQLPFWLIGALLPLSTALMAMRITRNRRVSVVAGFLMAFPCFYAIYMANTDSVAPYAMLGVLFFLVLVEAVTTRRPLLLLLLGALGGLAHLARADALILVGYALVAGALTWPRGEGSMTEAQSPTPRNVRARAFCNKLASTAGRVGLVLIAYLVVTAFWYSRNIASFGNLLPASGFRTLWLIRYDDLFHFPGSELTPGRFLSSGAVSILEARWQALGWNLQTLFFAQGWIVLFPFVVIGLVQLRDQAVVRCAVLYAAMLFAVMTVLFPWSGARGGYLHSGVALLPTFALGASVGVERTVGWLGGIRGWNMARARLSFSVGAVLVAAAVTGVSFQRSVVGTSPGSPAWSHLDDDYSAAGDWLRLHAPAGSRVMVNNPPCFYYRTGLSSVVVPDGDETTALAAADRYQARYLLLDANAPSGLVPIFEGTRKEPRLVEETEVEGGPQGEPLKIYRILPAP